MSEEKTGEYVFVFLDGTRTRMDMPYPPPRHLWLVRRGQESIAERRFRRVPMMAPGAWPWFEYHEVAHFTEDHDQGDEDGGTTLRSVPPAPVHMQMSRAKMWQALRAEVKKLYGGGPVKLPRAIFYAAGA